MANRTHFLQCQVFLTDKAAYDAAQTVADAGGGWLLGISPNDAATTYAAPLVIPGPSQTFFPPCITSGYFAENFNYPRNVAQFTKKSGGWFGIPALFGDTHTYKWCFEFKYAGSPANQTEIPGEPAPVAMGARRFVEGFENAKASGSNLSGNGSGNYNPQASRHIGGYGFAARNGQGFNVQHNVTEAGGAASNSGWDRFYVRLRKAPTTSQDVWKMVGAISGAAGARILINPSGQLEFQNVDSGSVRTSIGTGGTLVVDTWVKLDVLWQTGAAGFLKCYTGGVLAFQVVAGSLPAGTGLTQVQNVTGTQILDGQTTGHRGAWDVDDWVGGPLPTGGANPDLFPARDWNSGSKVVALRGKAAAASNTGNWAGPGGADAQDWRFTTQRPVISTSVQFLSSASASQRLAVVSDADRRIDLDTLNRGANGISIGAHARNATATPQDSTVGVKLPGAAEVTKTLAVVTSIDVTAGDGFLTHAGGSIEPVSPMAGTELSYTCNSSVSAKELANLVAQVECIGIFHPEDYVPQAGDPPNLAADSGIGHWISNDHHQHYPEAPDSIYGQPAPALVVIHTRTYVGNGKTQQIAFRCQPTWVFIRNTATHECCWWFCGAPAASHNNDVSTRATLITRAFIDPNFTSTAEDTQSQQAIIEIAGNNVANNASGVTYNMLAWCDPGMRFSECGGLWEQVASDVPRDTLLNTDDFLPELLLGFRQITGNTSTPGLYSKGSGNTTQGANLLNVAVLTTAVEFQTGKLVTPSGSSFYVNAAVQFTFLVFRRDDGSGDPNIGKVLQIASWTGDGSASRTISLAPITGRRPMWAVVLGSNGAGRQRDASHTSTNSLNLASHAQVTDGITAGAVDSISVGSALNVAATTFEALVFPGCDAVAVNNGWGGNCESIPVEPIRPRRRPPIVPPIEPIVPVVGTPPGITPLTPTGTITQCPTESTIVINMALSRIGVSKQLTSTTLNTEVSPEATVARLHYDEDVRAILRDFPWPFATRYEALTAIGGPADEQDIVQAYSAAVAYPVNAVVSVGGVLYYKISTAAAGTAVTNTAAWSTTPPEDVNGDWLYAYRAPTYMAMARRVVNNEGQRREWDPEPPQFRVGSDAVGAVIYSNVPNVELEYTVLDNCVARQGDALFRSALAWRHAHSLAPALTRDEKITGSCWEMYQRLLRDARTSTAQEYQHPTSSDVDWLAGR